MSKEKTVLVRRKYRAIVIDFPWGFKARAPNKNPESDRSVERHYKTMTKKEILDMATKIKSLMHPEGCHVFMWATGPFLEFAFEVGKAMGVRYSSTAFYFLKMRREFVEQIGLTTTDIAAVEDLFRVNLGFTTRKNIEPCLLFRYRSPKRVAKDVRELVVDIQREHSRKPEEVLARIEKYCKGPYLELFSRSSRPGWTCWGDEAGRFDKPLPKKPRKLVQIIKAPPLRIVDPRQMDMLGGQQNSQEDQANSD